MELYDFETAPAELQELSPYGGDEDGILVVPAGTEPPWWIDRLWRCEDGVFNVVLNDGRRVYIWAHA